MRGISSRLPMMRKLGKVFDSCVLLMVVYNRILEASEAARETGFNVEKKDLVRKFLSNPLLPVFSLFADFYISASAEALDLSRSKTRSRSASPKKKAKVSNSHEYADMTSLRRFIVYSHLSGNCIRRLLSDPHPLPTNVFSPENHTVNNRQKQHRKR